MDETIYLKIACPSCWEHVEFPSEMRGEIINCPHCSLSLLLDLPANQPIESEPETESEPESELAPAPATAMTSEVPLSDTPPSEVPPIDAPPSEAPPENLYQRLRALNNLEAKPVQIGTLETLNPKSEKPV